MESIGLQVKDGAHFEHLTRDQIEEIQQNFKICLPLGWRAVIFSQVPPCDTFYPWQPVDGCGNPLGKIKHYDSKEGAWK